MSSRQNYTGETINVGIDVHKNSYSVASILNGEIVKKDHMVASPEKLVSYFETNFKGAKINTAYEAGFSGFHLHRYLSRHNIHNLVVHPAAIEISARDRVKTDKRDALKIGLQLACGRLQSINVPSKKQEANRMVTRLRASLTNDKSRYANRLKALLFQYGLIEANDNSVACKKWINQILEVVKKASILRDLNIPYKVMPNSG